jgi:purine-nucleoside phosphorylase
MNPNYASGDIMVIDDHIHLMGGINPLMGVNDDRLGPRFPDMCRPYDPELIEAALEIARRENFAAHRGVYIALMGPNYETRAEYRWLRTLGDVVGMSTVPNVAKPDSLDKASGEEVIAAAKSAEPKLTKIVRGIIALEAKKA